jgi:hypothetical protein
MAIMILLVAGSAQAQTAATIYEIQQDNFPEGTELIVTGKIVTAVDDIASGFGFCIQEPAGGAHSALYVFIGTGAPPSVVVGDVVDVTGPYLDYFGLCELDLHESGGYTVVGSGPVPDPLALRAWQTRTSNPDEAEKWECVLVELNNLTALDLDPGYGAWFAVEFDYAVNDTTRFDDGYSVAGPPAGTQMSSIIGVVYFSYDDFAINPRSADDIQYIGAEPAPDLLWACPTGDSSLDVRFDRDVEQTTSENSGNYFLDAGLVAGASRDLDDLQLVHLTLQDPMAIELYLTLTVVGVQNLDGIPMSPKATQFWGGINSIPFVQNPDAGGDSSAIAGDIVTVRGVVHSKYDIWGSHVYIQNVNRTDYNGLELYLTTLLEEVEVGDIVVVSDMLGEYYNMTSMTEPFNYFEIVSSGNTVLPPELITVVDPIPANYERYEGALVEVQDVTVVERPGGVNFFEWSVSQDMINWLKVGAMGDYEYRVGLGDILNIRGTMRFDFNEFKIMPRSDDDFDFIWLNPIAVPGLPAGKATALGQNYPNPFNPKTKISFRLGTSGAAELYVFDPQGRMVRTLHTGELPAGEHYVVWGGETDSGGQAVSGVYFYRLQTADGSLTHRMVMLK